MFIMYLFNMYIYNIYLIYNTYICTFRGFSFLGNRFTSRLKYICITLSVCNTSSIGYLDFIQFFKIIYKAVIIIGSSVKLLEVFLTGTSQKESSFVNACLKALGKGGSIQEEVSLLAFCSTESVFKSFSRFL